MSKNSIISRSHLFFWVDYVYLFLDVVLIFGSVFIFLGETIHFVPLAIAFLITEVLLLTLFFYHTQYPMSLISNGHKYTRINVSLSQQLDKWNPIETYIYKPRLFLYALGITKTIIIAKCAETGDIKAFCPYCKHMMEIDEVQERCPSCNKKMHDNEVSI